MKYFCKHRPIIVTLFIVLASFSTFFVFQPLEAKKDSAARSCSQENLYCISEKLAVGTEKLRTLPKISVTPPYSPPTSTPTATHATGTVTYSVETRGAISASLSEFKTQAQQTFEHPNGWSRLGVSFQPVASGGDFTLVLAEASQVPSFSSGCSALYSCNVGRYVIINQDRWLGATPSWNNAGGSLRNYRHMVINHEVGHWLGHGHANCPAPGQPAAVMQQQSIDLQGCSFNPWPTQGEIYSPRLGI